MSIHADLAALAQSLSGFRYTVNNEADLQAAIAEVLDAQAPVREKHLTRESRPDLIVGRLAVEVKVAGTHAQALRQCQRYAGHDDVDGVLLVSTRREHAASITTLAGKPFRTVILRGGWA